MGVFSTEYSLPENIIQVLLNIYAEQTNLPIAFYSYTGNNFIWSQKGNYSPLCLGINRSFPLAEESPCDIDHRKRCNSDTSKIAMCHAGLWNISYPIKVSGKQVGTLISGQRRLENKDKDHKSCIKFNQYLEEMRRDDHDVLNEYFKNTSVINEVDFDTHLLSGLKNIQELLFSWNIALMEEEKKKKLRIQQQAHEFLLPIQSIVADAENLYNELADAEHKDIAQDILEEMQKLAIYAENMRSSLITQTVDRPYSFKLHNIYRPLMKSVELYQKEAGTKGIYINNPSTTSNHQFPDIEMSLEHLTRAFMNLIHNAVKYSFRSSKEKDRYFISIVGEPSSEFYKVCIIDYGIGILPDEISSGAIFSEGYRGLLSSDRERTGSGMGLSEVKKIIEKHKGNIEIISEKKGTGYKTSVMVYLPYRQKG